MDTNSIRPADALLDGRVEPLARDTIAFSPNFPPPPPLASSTGFCTPAAPAPLPLCLCLCTCASAPAPLHLRLFVLHHRVQSSEFIRVKNDKLTRKALTEPLPASFCITGSSQAKEQLESWRCLLGIAELDQVDQPAAPRTSLQPCTPSLQPAAPLLQPPAPACSHASRLQPRASSLQPRASRLPPDCLQIASVSPSVRPSVCVCLFAPPPKHTQHTHTPHTNVFGGLLPPERAPRTHSRTHPSRSPAPLACSPSLKPVPFPGASSRY